MQLANPVVSRCAFAMCGIPGPGGGIFVVGGCAEDRSRLAGRITEYYEIGTGRWTQLADMPHSRVDPEAVFWNGKVVVIGGRHPHSATQSAVDVYNLATQDWEEHSIPSIPTGTITEAIVVVESAERLYVYDRINDCGWMYDDNDRRWRALRKLSVRCGVGLDNVGEDVFT